MRDLESIRHDIQYIKQEIRYARAEGETERGMELLFVDLEQLENELHEVSTYERGLRNVSYSEV